MSKRGTSTSIRFGTTTNSYMYRMTKSGSYAKVRNPFVRMPSQRNTHWNGVEQLPSDRTNYGGAYKWKGHVASSTDTVTNAGLGDFDIMGRGFQEVADLLSNAGDAFTLMAQDAIAKGAVEGRKHASRLEAEKFNLGKAWHHSPYPGTPRGPVMKAMVPAHWMSASRFDPGLGGYRGVSSSGNSLRLINFNFKKGHTYKDLGGAPGTIEARVTSQMANLFENDARWRRKSPYWSATGGSGAESWRRFKPGDVRQGKHYFSQFYQIFDRGLLEGIKAAEASFQKRMVMNEQKAAKAVAKIQNKA